MLQTEKTSSFQKIIEAVEQLPLEDQAILVNIIHKRLQQQQRNELVEAVAEAREAYAKGDVRTGSIADLLAELDN